MSVDISVSITEDKVDIIATPTVNIVNVTNSASINPSLYDLSEFTNVGPDPYVHQSVLTSYVPTSRTITINGVTQDLSVNRTWSISAAAWGSITGTLSSQTDLQSALNAKQNTLTLTTTGTSGAATLVGSTLNIPQYSGGGGVDADSLFDFYTKEGLFIFDDMFLGQTTSLTNGVSNFSASGAGAIFVQSSAFFGLTPTTNQRGIVMFRTGATATGSNVFAFGATSSVGNMTTFFLDNGVINYECYVLVPILSNSTERYFFDFGISSQTASTGANSDYVGIVYNEGSSINIDNNLGGNPNFTFNTARLGTRTRTIGTSAVAANTWYKLRIEINPATPEVNFYVDNVLVATHTTNIPLTTTRVTPVLRMTKTIGTTARDLACDYVALKQTFNTPR